MSTRISSTPLPVPRSLFSEGGPALTAKTAATIRANLGEILAMLDRDRTEASRV